MIKIFIATPMYGGLCYGAYTDSLIKLLSILEKNDIQSMYRFVYNDSLITRARDSLVHEFLKSDCTHLLFLDADLVINPVNVLDLIYENKDIIGGCYPKKDLNLSALVHNVKQEVPEEHLLASSLEYVFNTTKDSSNKISTTTEVKDIGTGYLLIKKDVFEKLKKITPCYTANLLNNTDEKIYAFFQTSVDNTTNVLLSEDYHFCKEYRSIGGKIYVAPYARAMHIGTFYYG